MAFSDDSNLTELVPDILDFGITSFSDEHARAQADIEREIRNRWWHRKGIAGEMDVTYLTESRRGDELRPSLQLGPYDAASGCEFRAQCLPALVRVHLKS